MSNLPVDLGDRRVVVSVVVLLLAITILNWRVFQPLRAQRAGADDVFREETVYLPSDLAEMTGVAAARVGGGAAGLAIAGSDGAAGAGAGLRDPFSPGATFQPVAPQGAATAAASRPARRAAGLSCAAVMLGGERPTALINGKGYHPGDKVAGYEVERIGADGAVLRKDGRRLFLPVGGGERDDVHHPPVRGGRAPQAADSGDPDAQGGR